MYICRSIDTYIIHVDITYICVLTCVRVCACAFVRDRVYVCVHVSVNMCKCASIEMFEQ